MCPDERERLQRVVHPGITTFGHGDSILPCIVLEEARFDEIMDSVAGKPISVETNLNILHDGLGHVFVEVTLAFSQGGISEKILVNANESLGFFELLAAHAVLVLSARAPGESRVFMIQLPRPERAHDALGIIRKALVPR